MTDYHIDIFYSEPNAGYIAEKAYSRPAIQFAVVRAQALIFMNS